MTFLQKLLIITALAAAIATAAGSRTARPHSTATSGLPMQPLLWLAIVATALMLVGVVSHTLIRHCIQIVPLVLAGVLTRRSQAGVAAAAPLFAFWLLLMVSIWLFLAGIARIVTGTFTLAEIMLTVVIGVASVLGLVSVHRSAATHSLVRRVAVIAFFAVLQLAAVWASFQPFAAQR